MTWNLFIDDERDPPRDFRKWKIARTFDQVVVLISTFGMPNFISFDHDLGEISKSGFEVAKYLVELDLDGICVFSKDFDFYVHSQNPIGKANIEAYLNNYFKVKK